MSVGTLIGKVIRGVRKKTIFQVATASITRITKLTHNTAILRYTQQIHSRYFKPSWEDAVFYPGYATYMAFNPRYTQHVKLLSSANSRNLSTAYIMKYP